MQIHRRSHTYHNVCLCIHRLAHAHTVFFTWLKQYFTIHALIFFKFLQLKNWVNQLNMQTKIWYQYVWLLRPQSLTYTVEVCILLNSIYSQTSLPTFPVYLHCICNLSFCLQGFPRFLIRYINYLKIEAFLYISNLKETLFYPKKCQFLNLPVL